MEKLTVIGCGTMGHSIALNAAWAGVEVKMYGVNIADTQRGRSGILSNLHTMFNNGLISQKDIEEISDRVFVTSLIEEAVNQSSFIIEAIPESINLKMDLFQYLDKMSDENVVLASNTSGLSPTTIASRTNNPERVLVTHFWNPAHLIPLVEIVRGKQTSDETVKRTLSLLKIMRKRPIEVKKEIPGFVANRLQFALFREAQYLLEEGIASKEDIDAAVVYSIGRRLCVTGPLVSADMGGLDVFEAISNYLFGSLSNAESSFPTLENLVKNNKLGSKSHDGYYNWDKQFSEKMNSMREKELIRLLKQDFETDLLNYRIT